MCDLKDPSRRCDVKNVHLDSLHEEKMVETKELWMLPEDTKLLI